MLKLKTLEFIYRIELGAFLRAFRGINITIGAKSAHTYFEQIFLSIKIPTKYNQNLFHFAAPFLFFPFLLILLTHRVKQGKGKAIPLQAWTGPEGSRSLRLPDFKTIGT
jgi:hypothetical protein